MFFTKKRLTGASDLQPRPAKKKNWRLEPESGVELVDGVPHAVSLPIWLRLEPVRAVTKRRWVRLRYSSGFFDEPVRPLIRFGTKSGKTFVQPMNGAILGSAEWIGRVPNDTVSVSISPSRRLGPFSFRVDGLEWLSRRKLLRGGFFTDPLWVFWAIRSRFLDSQQEAWQSVKYALGGTPLDRYSEWCARMTRPLDLGGFDRPRVDWTNAPRLRFFMPLANRKPKDLQATLQCLRAQAYERWSLHGIARDGADPDLLASFREEAAKDERLLEFVPSDSAPAKDYDETDRVAIVQAGDLLPEYALAVVAETLADRPNLTAVYSDEDAIDASGKVERPMLKPDWSPVFHKTVPYMGRLTFVKYGDLTISGMTALSLLSDEQTTLHRLVAQLDPRAIGHIRRVLYRSAQARRPLAAPALALRQDRQPDPVWPEVSIVIPTRDRAKLLAICTQGLKKTTDYPSFNVVIVDNGSTQPAARALLNNLRKDQRFHVLERPEPFNYSKLNNDGARATDAPMLVFLNNDVRMLDPGWLKAIVRWAMQPQVGVVGAKLLFPNGRIQHAGIVLGMGGISGHIYRRTAWQRPSYLRQAVTTREMAAVTGACIAVERAKFEAVGGFDAINLPIDLNDIDFCLRIAERGWTNIWASDAVLTHVQSASRGMERNPFDQYRRERAHFINRWVEAIRDDPYFHPGFSLSAHRPALA
jgi:GT2 family glycosyltransferase